MGFSIVSLIYCIYNNNLYIEWDLNKTAIILTILKSSYEVNKG